MTTEVTEARSQTTSDGEPMMQASCAAAARAAAEQLRASDPAVSAFVAASAGSGKTKLLADRLLRLMLADADPARIQCLTFTKAAAAEMANRLTQLLAEWVRLDDAALDARLAALRVTPSEETRTKARGLFVKVLDLPGGMRIGTIHAFCQSLLRRFPLEAAISPHFRVVEPADAASALHEARERVIGSLDGPAMREAVDNVASLVTLDRFTARAGRLLANPERLDAVRALGGDLSNALRRSLDLDVDDETTLIARAVDWPQAAAVRHAAMRIRQKGSAGTVARANEMLDWLAIDSAERDQYWGQWTELFHNASGSPVAASRLVNLALQYKEPELLPPLLDEQARIARVEDSLRAFRLARLAESLLRLALPIAASYDDDKTKHGLLDYDDLIARSVALMHDPGAAWVLYKLDGGLDHLLLDEVQDTAPAQWRIADALTAEFYAGLGNAETSRTVFAVGDRKQSIYSFQGADPHGFDRWSKALAKRVTDAGGRFEQTPLRVSFRSTEPVLTLVDSVFAQASARPGVAGENEDLHHYAHRVGNAGRIELWPLVPPPDRQPPEPWTVPDDYHGQSSAPQRLADRLADWIVDRIGKPLPSQGRDLHAGDILILIRRRNEFQHLLVRALKTRHVAVAGLDRLALADQTAVGDLLALCETLLLPQDDLSLACVLTSPLGGISDDSLMALAMDRRGTLWDELRDRADERPEWTRAHAMLAQLFARVDYVPPHALLAEALGPLGGRARLFARLGHEAAEPVDELLGQALAYGRTHAASLQGFLHWLRASNEDVRREPEGAGDAVRIMTVHGAKGLQAPLVILPDTTAMPPADDDFVWVGDPVSGVELPIWAPIKGMSCQVCDQARANRQTDQHEEHHRLLYVALTRAEDELLVCGWQPRRSLPDGCWYELVRQGFESLPDVQVVAQDDESWPGERRFLACQQTVPPRVRPARHTVQNVPTLPDWVGRAPDWIAQSPPVEPQRARPFAPSHDDGDDPAVGPVPPAASPLERQAATARRFHRGRLLHGLLQHLPDLPPGARDAAARLFLARAETTVPPDEIDALVKRSLAIISDPDLALLFGPESRVEVPLTGITGGPHGERLEVGGLVDRLAVSADEVLLADYKTNRAPPESVAATPALYLRQMAAYRAIVRDIFPGRSTRCLIIWTHTGRIDTLSDDLLDGYAPHVAGAA